MYTNIRIKDQNVPTPKQNILILLYLSTYQRCMEWGEADTRIENPTYI